MPQALILSGAGRYADPWHPFADTSARLADLAQQGGWEVVTDQDPDTRLAAGLDGIDLLIVNTGDPWTNNDDDATGPKPELIEQGRTGLARAFQRGISVLGIHTAAASLRDYPQFRAALGGEWVRGRSWHPLFGQVTVRPLHDQIVEGLSDFTVEDERYTDLDIDPSAEPLAWTGDQDQTYILAWAHQYQACRIVYSALGHDTRSYDSKGHRLFLQRALNWLQPRPVFDD